MRRSGNLFARTYACPIITFDAIVIACTNHSVGVPHCEHSFVSFYEAERYFSTSDGIVSHSLLYLASLPLSDVFADEIAWAIQDFDTGETVAQRTYGFYEHENEVREVVMVRPGHVYTFTIKDVYGDGITDNGYYQIFAFDGVDESNTDGMIVSATRFTGREQQRTFLAPYPLSNENLATSRRDTTEPPSDVPSATPSTNPSDMPSAGPSIELSFGNDGFSNDIGRLCIANGHFCRDNESCCSSICYSGLCLKNPNSRHDQHIHQNEGNQGG